MMSFVVNGPARFGLLIMVVSESATLAQIEPFWSWNTPICWTGFILFADAIVFHARGRSWMRSSPGEFARLALLSIPLWLVFEGYNLVIRNWYYTGLPEHPLLRALGYAWSFATIWPAIFECADLISIWRGEKGAVPLFREHPRKRGTAPFSVAWPSVVVGAGMLSAPFVTPPGIARYLAAPVWLGFIFLLDPLNARLGGESLMLDWRAGRADRAINLMLSGLSCGVLWEFWNYWARAKWHYAVPILARLKIFEMPLPGYLGFPPFALECFAMYVFVRLLFRRLGI